MIRTSAVLMLLLLGCTRARLEEKVAEFEKSGRLFQMWTCLCPGQRLTRAQATFGAWPSRRDCFDQNTAALEALKRFSEDGTPVGIIFRREFTLTFGRESIFLEPGAATHFHEELDCAPGERCAPLTESFEPSSATVTLEPGSFTRTCDGVRDLDDVSFTTALIVAGTPTSASWVVEAPYSPAIQTQRVGCDGTARPGADFKDGVCDEYFNCENLLFDGGDCQ